MKTLKKYDIHWCCEQGYCMKKERLSPKKLLRFLPISSSRAFKKNPDLAQLLPPQLQYETASEPAVIKEVQQFRAKVFGSAYNIHFEKGTDADEYDPYSVHCLVRDLNTGKIVACTRVITPDAKDILGRYYAEHEFDLRKFLQDKQDVYEIGRTCVDEEYRGSAVLATLWLGMMPLVLNELGAKYLMGTVSVNLAGRPAKLVATEAYLKYRAKTMLFKSLNTFDLNKYLGHEHIVYEDIWLNDDSDEEQEVDTDFKLSSTTTDKPKKHLFLKYRKKDVPVLFKQYRRMGAVFSKQGYYDELFNCVDYLSLVKVDKKLIFKLNMVCGLMNMKAKTKKKKRS